MPIVTIDAIGEPPEPEIDVQALADALGDLFGLGPAETWVRLRWLPREQYAENSAVLPQDVEPVFVDVLKGEVPEGAHLAHEAQRIAELVSAGLRRKTEHTHVVYQPAGIGRVAFGGVLETGEDAEAAE